HCAAKFAVRAFTDALRLELAHEGSRIRVTMVQLPAVNTPQFDWARSRMAEKAQPAPPIFQPEAIAGQIARAARERPPDVWVGRSDVNATLGTMLLAGSADPIVSAEGYDGELPAEPRDTARPDNLFSPPSGDPGARGRFDNQARTTVIGFDPTRLR